MDFYGNIMRGSFNFEIVDTKPLWDETQVGRILFEQSTSTSWVAGITAQEDWIKLGIHDNSIQSSHINWDYTCEITEEGISAWDFPALDGEINVSNLQNVSDDLLNKLNLLKSGELFFDDIILPKHLNITADDIPIINYYSYFVGVDVSIEEALNQLSARNATNFLLDPDGNFGLYIPLFQDPLNVQIAFETIEVYLNDLNGYSVKATYPKDGGTYYIQLILDGFYDLITNLTFIELNGTPVHYGDDGQFLVTDGTESLSWTDISATDIVCTYPTVSDHTNVQNALWDIQATLDAFVNLYKTHTHATSTITYSKVYNANTFSNVAQALNYLLLNGLPIDVVKDAELILCSNIGTTSNVQQALGFLYSEIERVETLFPTNLGTEQIIYNSTVGTTNVSDALAYLFTNACNKENHNHDDLYYTRAQVDAKFAACFSASRTGGTGGTGFQGNKGEQGQPGECCEALYRYHRWVVECSLKVPDPYWGAKPYLSCAFVLDYSASMTSKTSRLVNAVKWNLDNTLTDLDAASIITFSNEVQVNQTLTSDFTAVKNAVTQGYGLYRDRTALWDAGISGLRNLIDNCNTFLGLPFLILTTDGKDNQSSANKDTFLSLANQYKIPVYCVGIWTNNIDELNLTELNQISDQTGGMTFTCQYVEELLAIYEYIISNMQRYAKVGDKDNFQVTIVNAERYSFGEIISNNHELPLNGPPVNGFQMTDYYLLIPNSVLPANIVYQYGYTHRYYKFTPSPGLFDNNEQLTTLSYFGAEGIYLHWYMQKNGRSYRFKLHEAMKYSSTLWDILYRDKLFAGLVMISEY